jgi:hypothetical protein
MLSQNGLVDGLECVSALGAAGAATAADKAKFVFRCFDFSSSGVITSEELSLLLKSCAEGLCKLSGAQPPALAQIEAASDLITGLWSRRCYYATKNGFAFIDAPFRFCSSSIFQLMLLFSSYLSTLCCAIVVCAKQCNS